MKEQSQFKRERAEVARFTRRLCKHVFTNTSGANISPPVPFEHVVITPVSTGKGRMFR